MPVSRRCVSLSYLSVLVTCVLALSDTPATAGQAASVVSGTVVARETGRPIADATVTVEGSTATVTTTAVGRFELAGPSLPRQPGGQRARLPGNAGPWGSDTNALDDRTRADAELSRDGSGDRDEVSIQSR